MGREAGAEQVRECLVMFLLALWEVREGRRWEIVGEEEGDFRDDFKGLPSERTMGLEVAHVTVGYSSSVGDDAVDVRGETGGDRCEERGKGIEKSSRNKLLAFSVRGAMCLSWSSSMSESGVVTQLLDEDESGEESWWSPQAGGLGSSRYGLRRWDMR